jgi:WD40 repeat protein
MKKVYSLLLLPVIALSFMNCSKNSSSPTTSRSYKMYNYSSGSAVEAGSLTLNETSNGNASISVSLSNLYLVPGKVFKSYLILRDSVLGVEVTYAILSDIDGATGVSTTAPLINSSTNIAIKYEEIVSDKRYSVKVYNSNTIQAIGKIE